jgi:4,4'-dithiodibutanoate disulfide reductase
MYYFRGDVPMAEFIASQPAVVGLWLRALSMPLILLGGVNTMATVSNALTEGFEFVAMARTLLRDPALVNKFQADTANEGLCGCIAQNA